MSRYCSIMYGVYQRCYNFLPFTPDFGVFERLPSQPRFFPIQLLMKSTLAPLVLNTKVPNTMCTISSGSRSMVLELVVPLSN